MKQTQRIKPIPHGNLVDCSASLKKLTALQAPIPILSVCVCTPELRCTGGNNDIAAGTDTDFVGACTPAQTLREAYSKKSSADDIRSISWSWKGHYCVRSNPPLGPTLSQMTPIHILVLHVLNKQCRVLLQTTNIHKKKTSLWVSDGNFVPGFLIFPMPAISPPIIIMLNIIILITGLSDEAVPLQAWCGPEGSRKLRFPDYVTMAQNGGKVVSLTHRPPLPPGNAPGTHFC